MYMHGQYYTHGGIIADSVCAFLFCVHHTSYEKWSRSRVRHGSVDLINKAWILVQGAAYYCKLTA